MNGVTMSFDWNDQQSERLQALYDSGLSFTQIAADMGCSRNAAIGKAHRMHLAAREPVLFVKKSPRPRVAHRVIDTIKEVFAVAAKKTEETAPAKDYRCSITELNDKTCRFPMWAFDAPLHGERFYCGVPEAELSTGQPYCRKHAQLCNPQRQ